jgi:tetratricopeptide (TPR) repeat protein
MEEASIAVEYFKRAAKVEPLHYLNVALIYEKLDDKLGLQLSLADASKALYSQLEVNPASRPIRLALAEILFKQNIFSECESILLKGIEQSPSAPMKLACSNFWVKLYLDLGPQEFDQGFKLATQALELAPENEKAQAIVIALYQHHHKDKKRSAAILNWLSSFAGQKESKPASFAATQFLLGAISSLQGNAKKAASHTKAAVEIAPNNSRFVHRLANQLQRFPEQVPQAAEFARQAVALEPDETRYRLTLGLILAKMNLHEQATIELDRCLMAKHNLSGDQINRIHIALSNCYESLGRWELAEAHAKRIGFVSK